MSTKAKTKAVKKKKKPVKENDNIQSIDEVITFAINSVVPGLDQEVKETLSRIIITTVTDIDKEIQFIRDTRMRDFLRQHIDDKLVVEFLDSLAPLKIIDHLSSRSV